MDTKQFSKKASKTGSILLLLALFGAVYNQVDFKWLFIMFIVGTFLFLHFGND